MKADAAPDYLDSFPDEAVRSVAGRLGAHAAPFLRAFAAAVSEQGCGPRGIREDGRHLRGTHAQVPMAGHRREVCHQ